MIFVYILVFAIYAALLYGFVVFVAKPLLLLGSAAMVVVVCGRYFQALGETLFWGAGEPDMVRGKEPAFYGYFFGKAWRDYRRITLRARDLMVVDAGRCIGWGRVLMNPLTWFFGLTLWAITVASAIPALLVVAYVGVVHVLMVALAAGVVYLAALVFRLLESVNMAVRKIHGRCPTCHRGLSLPVYLCQCGARHTHLVPGQYGSIYRRCRCGRELPTLFLFGRSRLTAICPHCGHGLNATILTVGDLFIPIVGGVSSGKSSVMTATLVELEKKESGVAISFPAEPGRQESVDERNYHRARAQYMSGQSVEKTNDQQVRAFQVCLESAEGRRRLLYAYDAAGEIHRGEHALGSLPYYRHIDGLLFLIDPFSLVDDRSPGGAARLTASADAPQDVYDQVVRSLIRYAGRRSIRGIPVAMLVTKTDACGFRARMLDTPVVAATGRKPLTAEEARSLAIREWLLRNHAGGLVQSAELYFRHVRYFECSALGRVPDESTAPFEAQGILDPWAWILRERGLTIRTKADR